MDKEDSGVSLSHEKEWNQAIRSNTHGPRECHTEWSEPDREEMLHDIAYLWNVWKNDANELTNRKRLTDLEKELPVARGKE